MRYFIEIGYLGTNYHGWQIQPNANSIQEELEKSLSTVLNLPIRIHGSSRTDTGVHARQQFAHIDLESLSISVSDLVWRLNSFLPKDISINGIHSLSETAHARFDATDRKYIYRINLEKDPFVLRNSLYFRKPLDLPMMNAAAQILFKHKDFQCFSKVKTEVNNFICTMEIAEWRQNGANLEFHIKANRFLRGMVRAVVGTLLDVGLGKISLEGFEDIILSKDRTKAGGAVKAHGLTLEEVNYPLNYFEV